MSRPLASARLWLGGMVLLPLAAVSAALFTQHVLGMQPCPWCILQRLIFVAISAVSLLGLALPLAGAALAGLLSAGGIGAALWQHFVAASTESCDLSLADRIVAATGLDGLWPEVFMPMSSCADAKVTLLGLPYEFWSLGIFVVLGASAIAVWRLGRR